MNINWENLDKESIKFAKELTKNKKFDFLIQKLEKVKNSIEDSKLIVNFIQKTK